MPDTLRLDILRYRPEPSGEPEREIFEIPFRSEWMVLDGLNYIKDRIDGTLSYRWACRMGICGSCGVMVDGKPVLTCATYLDRLLPGPIRIDPLRGFPVIRDLVVDLADFVDKLATIEPRLVPGETPPAEGEAHRQTPDEIDAYERYALCINCMLCYAACPVYEVDPEFSGPAVIALAQRYNLDSRDAGSDQRLQALDTADGLWPCTFVGECSTVCPKGVDPAGAIQRYKLTAATKRLAAALPFSKSR